MKERRTHLAQVMSKGMKKPNRKKMSKLFGILVVGMFAVAACTTTAPATPVEPSANVSEKSQNPDTAAASSRGSDVEVPLDFQIAVYQGEDVLGGQRIEFSEVVGQGKPVVLNFWAGLCPPCRLEMPDFQAVHDELGDQILLVGVDVGTFVGLGTEEDGRALLQEVGVTYPAGTTSNAEVMKAYQVIGMPTTVFIAPNGEVVQKWTGLLTKSKMEELVQNLLDASQGS